MTYHATLTLADGTTFRFDGDSLPTLEAAVNKKARQHGGNLFRYRTDEPRQRFIQYADWSEKHVGFATITRDEWTH